MRIYFKDYLTALFSIVNLISYIHSKSGGNLFKKKEIRVHVDLYFLSLLLFVQQIALIRSNWNLTPCACSFFNFCNRIVFWIILKNNNNLFQIAHLEHLLCSRFHHGLSDGHGRRSSKWRHQKYDPGGMEWQENWNWSWRKQGTVYTKPGQRPARAPHTACQAL